MKMSLKLTLLFLLSFAVVAIVSGCSAFAVTVSSIQIYPSNISLQRNSQAILRIAIYPENASNRNITWRSENPAVAIVNSAGIVTGISSGSTYIVATSESNNRESYCGVTVTDKEVRPTKLTMDPTSITMETQETRILNLSFTPSNATTRTEWISSNTNVAVIDDGGRVTARGKGTATITARSAINNNLTAKCTVNVLAPQTITGVDLSRTSATLYVNTFVEIDAKVLGQDIRDSTVSTSVTGTSYVSVNKTNTSSGARLRISGKKAGTATIKVYSNANSYYYSTITVTVLGY